MKPVDPQARWRTLLLGCVMVMAVLLSVWMLRATALVVVPVICSIFLALLVAPVDRWGTMRAPDRFRWLGHVAAMGTILFALLVFLGGIWFAAQQVVERFPLGSGEAGGLLPSFGSEAPAASEPTVGEVTAAAAAVDATEIGSNGILSRLRDLFGIAGGSLSSRLAGWASGYAATILGAAGTTFGAAVLIFFLTLMMLIEAPRWRKKISSVSSKTFHHDTMESVAVIADRLRSYLWARTLLGVITAALYVAWLWIFGVDLLIVWVLLTFFLNFIPNLGSLIAGILPVLYAFVQKHFGTALAVGAGIFAIEQIMGNYVDPRVQGTRVSLSPLVVLIVLLFWGWMWGIIGTVLAVPITISIAVISAHVGLLRPLAVLLGDETDPEGTEEAGSGHRNEHERPGRRKGPYSHASAPEPDAGADRAPADRESQ